MMMLYSEFIDRILYLKKMYCFTQTIRIYQRTMTNYLKLN